MGGLLSRLDGFAIFLLVPIVGGLILAVIALIADAWRKVRQSEIAADLKRDMLNRGMSADEIQTVLNAGESRRKPVTPPPDLYNQSASG